ncbi:hypothetical protein [Apilactobacillus kunkeei]|uniref:hypothetical protein n=1 Tax=Apilactobacillus kunkeei TaxID=148814 RepID=UPI0040345A05
MLIGGNIPEIKNGIWITKTTKSNWIKRVPVYTTSKKTVLKFGDPVKAMKIDESNEMLVIDGKGYKVTIKNNQHYAISSNTLVLKLTNGATRLQSLYNPGDSRVILPKTYTPSNGDQWFQYNPKQGNYKVYVYNGSLEGWLFREMLSPKQTTSTTANNTNNTSTTK